MGNHYFVSIKNGWTWISAVLMVLSMGMTVALFTVGERIPGAVMAFQLVLPLLAGLYFVMTILLAGREHFYRTSLSAWGFALSFCHLASIALDSKRLILLLWVVYVVLALFYTLVVCGKFKYIWALWLVTAVLTAFFVYDGRLAFRHGALPLQIFVLGKNALMGGGFFAISLAIRSHPDGSGYHPIWGDRPDGRRVRSLPGITNIIPYIMVNRNGADNVMRSRVDIGEMERYIWKKRREGLDKFGITHVFLAAYVRMVAEYPAVNRFCSGQKIYSRGENVEFSMTIKKEMIVDAPDTTIKVHLAPDETVESIYHKFHQEVVGVKGTPLDSNVDNTIKVLNYIPGLFLKFTVWLLKTMDYFGALPKFLLEVSPFHGSVFFTSMGSLGIPPIVHHLYDFGNVPVFIAFGRKEKVREIAPDGKVVTKKFIEYTANTDERIVDGFYFATAMKCFERYLEKPSKLDEPVRVNHDVD
ncbi:MAG: hypothetical protein R3Y62_03035 [Eubacteriales bacterium]